MRGILLVLCLWAFSGTLRAGSPAPCRLEMLEGGLRLVFDRSLDTQKAADPDNYRVKTLNAVVTLKSATPSTDEREVFLELDGPAPTLGRHWIVRYRLADAAGQALVGEVALPASSP